MTAKMFIDASYYDAKAWRKIRLAARIYTKHYDFEIGSLACSNHS